MLEQKVQTNVLQLIKESDQKTQQQLAIGQVASLVPVWSALNQNISLAWKYHKMLQEFYLSMIFSINYNDST